jgi:hydrophobe/amphiphile efflux-1 (HAE1) family protein
MQKLAEICIRRPVFASVLVLVLCVTGLFGYLKLGIDRYPDIELPFVTVSTALPGAAPEEIETEITDPIEEAVNTVSGIKELRSTSAEGISNIFIQFELEKDPDVATQEVRDRISRILRQLPEDISDPVVEKVDPDASPILTIALSADRPVREITEYADKTLRRRLESAYGVGQVQISGGEERQINVFVNPVRLRAEGLNITDVSNALRRENAQLPGGTLKRGPEEFTVRTLGRVENVADLRRLPVGRNGDRTVTIADVARVEDSIKEKDSTARLNGEATVLLRIRKQSKTNTVAVVDAVKERMEEMKPSLPQGYSYNVLRDDSVFIKASLHNVQEHLIVGSVFAALVVLIFLASWRSTLIAAVAIPISVVSTFGLMWFMGLTLNVVTLLALTLSVGIVVDDAIVVLENIYRYIDEKGFGPYEAAVYATREIGLAVLSITLSLIAVFLPIAFMEGIVGIYMESFGITMSFAIAVSMLVSFTLTPMLSARMLRGKGKPGEDAAEAGIAGDPVEPKSHWWHRWSPYAIIERTYMAMLRFSLRQRWLIVLVCFGALYSNGPLIKNENKNIMPDDDQSEFQVSVRAPEGTSLETTELVIERIARDIRRMQGVKYTESSAGGRDASNEGDIDVGLVDVDQRDYTQFQLMALVREKILPKYDKEMHLRTSVGKGGGGGGGSGAAVQYVVTGPEFLQLKQYADQVIAELKKVPGTVDVDSSLVIGKPQYGININRPKAAELGVSVSDIAETMRILVAGDEVSSYDEGGERYEVNLRGDASMRNNPDLLSQVTIASKRLGTVPITDVIDFEPGTGPTEIERLNRRRQVTVSANVEPGFSQQKVIDAANAAAAKLQLQPGYGTTLAGSSKDLNEAQNAFFTVFLMSLIFMYLVIAAQFESWLNPFIILLSLPLTMPFALFSVWATNESLNIFSTLGVLVLFAVVKKNSILQIDHTNHLRSEGMERTAAILQANRDRLRPILMTTVAFVAGMVPLALSRGTGSATNHTIASVVIGGQTLSLLLTLLAIPVAYSLFDDASHSRVWKWISGLFGGMFGNQASAKELETVAETGLGGAE